MASTVYTDFVDLSNTGWSFPVTIPKIEFRGFVPWTLVKDGPYVKWIPLMMSVQQSNPNA